MCSVCLRKICPTSSGVIRSHGPAGRRCKGAGKPVINSNSDEPQDHDNPPSQSQPSESLVPIPIEAHQEVVVECLPDVTVVKRIPKAMETPARRASRKIDAGDLIGAIRLASSNETLANYDDSTFSALQSKHPSPHPDSIIPPSVTPRATFDACPSQRYHKGYPIFSKWLGQRSRQTTAATPQGSPCLGR